jgi:iron complex outermembrane receptor protein
MTKKRCGRIAIAATITQLLTWFALGFTASAQNTAPPPNPAGENSPAQTSSAGGELQQITVTGYILPRVGDGPQPVTTIDQDYIQKHGEQTVQDVINSLPQSIGYFTPVTTAGNSFAPGGSAVGLKGLPYNATLILVDGIRFPEYPFFINSVGGGPVGFVDLNSFPTASVDRIELLKDGGSATYGSDAVAGVINIILKDDYNGADLTYYYGISQRGDFEVDHASLVGGISQQLGEHSKFSIVAAFDFYDQSPIMSSDRWYSNILDHSLLATNYPPQPNFYSPLGNFVDPSGNFYVVNPGTTGRKITPSDFAINGNAPVNYSTLYQQIVPRETRYGGSVKAEYSPTDWLRLYDTMIIQRNEELSVTPNQGYSSSDTINGVPITVPANNPYNPFGVSLTNSGYPSNQLAEFGPWVTDTIVRTIRNTSGATLQLPFGWYVDGSFTYGESDGTETVNNSVIKSALQEALNGTLPGYQGIFFNPFTDQTIGHPNAIFYPAIRTQQILNSRTDLINYILKAGGTLISLPSGDLTIAGGLEYRSESLIQSNDPNSRIDNITSSDFPGKLASARRNIWSIYGEADIPLLGNKWSWPGARSLEVVLSERQDYYSDFGSAAKPKIAVRYQPISDLTFRGTYEEGFIAPSLAQLFGTAIPGVTSINDPVLGTSYTTLSTTGANAHLKPETSYGYYLGAVWSPGSKDPEHSWWGWANGFSAYIDWYEVSLRNLIGQISPQELVDLSSSFPGAVVRGPTGAITNILATYQNIGAILTEGIDFGASYVTKEFFWGKLDFEANASWIYNFSAKQLVGSQANGLPNYEIWNQTDSYGIPDFKLIASLFYSKTVFGIDTARTGLTLNFVDSEHDINDNYFGTFPQAVLDAPGYVHLVGNWLTFDWQISYKFGAPSTITPETPKPGYDKEGKKMVGEKAVAPPVEGRKGGIRWWLANTTLTFGINNIFDTRPPYSSDWYQGFDTGDATPMQRYFYVQIDKKF